MKQRIILFILIIMLLAGVLYWFIPQATTFYAQIIVGTATVEPTTPATIVAATPPATITPTAQAVPTQTLSGLSTENSIILIVLSVGFLILVQVVYVLSRRSSSNKTNYGSAHFARGEELREFQVSFFARVFRRNKESRLVLGKSAQGALILLNERQQESNILLTAPVGSGKSSRVIIPNLLRERGNRSLVISDVKGELLRVTGGAVSQHHKVYVFAPSRPEESHGYNPLGYITTTEDAQDLAHCWISNTGQSQDDSYWTNLAEKLMVSVILHLKKTEPDAPFSRVADLLCSTGYDKLKKTLTESPSETARKETQPFFEFMEKNERLIGGLMTDIGSRFRLLLSEDIKAVTSRNEIQFQHMVEHPSAFYLSIPRRGAERCQPLLATLVMQMFASFEREAERSPKGRLPRGVMCYLDEFANLGYIPGISQYISTARSSGVGMLLAIQSFSQLQDRYDRAVKENILANTVSHLLLPGAGLEETEYYSRRLGVTTIATESHSTTMRPYNSNQSMMINNTSRGHTEGQSQRSLQTADELRTMKKGTLLFVHASSPAAMLKTTAYFEDRKLKKLADQPFELELPWEHMASLSGLDQEREVEATPEVTVPIVMEPWSSLVWEDRTEEQETDETEQHVSPE